MICDGQFWTLDFVHTFAFQVILDSTKKWNSYDYDIFRKYFKWNKYWLAKIFSIYANVLITSVEYSLTFQIIIEDYENW